MFKMPASYDADRFKNSETNVKAEINGKWVLARPEPFWGLCIVDRLKATWDVFTGKADCLYWTEQ